MFILVKIIKYWLKFLMAIAPTVLVHLPPCLTVLPTFQYLKLTPAFETKPNPPLEIWSTQTHFANGRDSCVASTVAPKEVFF